MSFQISLRRFVLTTMVAGTGLFAVLPLAHADCNATAPEARYTVNGGEVYDSKTNLTWQRCSVGQTWSQDACSGKVQSMTWDQAMKSAKGEWRLPTRDELLSLVEAQCGLPKANKAVFPNMDDYTPMYWTSTADEKELALLVAFNNGTTFNGYRTGPNGVRLVRSGK